MESHEKREPAVRPLDEPAAVRASWRALLSGRWDDGARPIGPTAGADAGAAVDRLAYAVRAGASDAAVDAAAWALGEAAEPRRRIGADVDRALLAHERAMRRGDAGYGVTARDVADVGEWVRRARDTPDGAYAALLALAVLAIRVALNLADFGGAAGPTGHADRAWREHLLAVCEGTVQAADRWAATGGVAQWWRSALALRPPQVEFARAADASTDRTLRAEALSVSRTTWARRAACELVLVRSQLGDRPATFEQRLQWMMVDVAARRLADAQLAAWPGRFDHRGAWARCDQLVAEALRAHLDSPKAGWERDTPDPRALPLLAASVSRAWLAIALADAQLGDRIAG
jgi:hypothetical protein